MNIRMFDLAKIASDQSNLRCRVGAVILVHKPVSLGFNQSKTHPLYADGLKAYTLHAEITALLRARCDVAGGIIYVYRSDRNNQAGLAKPCSTCMSALIEAGIKRIYYTTGQIDGDLTWDEIDL